MKENTDLNDLETGAILTPPGYLNYACWRIELHKQGKTLPAHSTHFSAEPFYALDEKRNHHPRYYTITRHDYGRHSLEPRFSELLDIIDNEELDGKACAALAAEKFARQATNHYKKNQSTPYLGEMVLQKGKFVLERWEKP